MKTIASNLILLLGVLSLTPTLHAESKAKIREAIRAAITEIDELHEEHIKGLLQEQERPFRAYVAARITESVAQVGIHSPIYEIHRDRVRLKGSTVHGEFELNEKSYELRQESKGDTTTFLIKNKITGTEGDPERVENSAFSITREDGEIIKIGVGSIRDGRRRPELNMLEIRDWEMPDVSMEPDNRRSR